LSVGSLAISRTRRPPTKKPAQAAPIQSHVHNMSAVMSAVQTLRYSRRSMESGMPDCGFGRCDGHHKMVVFRLGKKKRNGRVSFGTPLSP